MSVYWHLVGVAVIFVLLFWAPESGTHQSVGFLFGSEGWQAFEGLSGFTIPLYVFLIGLLNAQYTFTGYDASAHVSEETVQARISAPKGIVNSIWISMIAGFILLLGVSMAIPPGVATVPSTGSSTPGTTPSPSTSCRGRRSSSTPPATPSASCSS